MTFKAPLDLTVHAPDGMYDPANEHDACGVGMVTTLNKRPERKIVTDAIDCLLYTSPSPRDVEESRMPSSA